MNTQKPVIEFFKPDTSTEQLLPFVEGLKAGFPSPAQDYTHENIDLNQEVIKNPSSTFFARINGDSLNHAGLYDGDIIVVDRSLRFRDKKLYVCAVDGEFTVKYVKKEREEIWLIPANEKYKPIKVTAGNDFIIWGEVIRVIHKPREFDDVCTL